MDVSAISSNDEDITPAVVIKDVARHQLEKLGASGLSPEAVSRDSGIPLAEVEAVFPHRDDLLTALVIDAYDASGEAMEQADAAAAAAGGSGAHGSSRSPAHCGSGPSTTPPSSP